MNLWDSAAPTASLGNHHLRQAGFEFFLLPPEQANKVHALLVLDKEFKSWMKNIESPSRTSPMIPHGASIGGGIHNYSNQRKEFINMSPARMSKIESSIRAVLAFNEAFNRHDAMGMMSLMSEDCVFENTDPAPDGTVYAGKEAVTKFWQDFFRESPQAHIDIEEIFGFGDRCVMRWKYSWMDAAGSKGDVRGWMSSA